MNILFNITSPKKYHPLYPFGERPTEDDVEPDLNNARCFSRTQTTALEGIVSPGAQDSSVDKCHQKALPNKEGLPTHRELWIRVRQGKMFALEDAPDDGVSCLQFSATTSPILLCSAWDCSLRTYDVSHPSPLRSCVVQPSAALSACFCGGDEVAATGLVDGAVRLVAMDALPRVGTDARMGAHAAGVRCLEYAQSLNLLFSGSWDKTVCAWDPRRRARVVSLSVPGKVFAMAYSANSPKLVVGTADRHVMIFDARKLDGGDAPLQRGVSSLKHQTRCIRCFPSGEGYALSSIEGRVALEYFDSEDLGDDDAALKDVSQADSSRPVARSSRAYGFKCHRAGNVAYPVNALAFHPTLGTFATGGTDGYVNLWDGRNKKRLAQLDQFPTSVAALTFSKTGSLLAVASSYAFEEGEKDHPKDQIFIHHTQPFEVTPKANPKPAVTK